MGEGPDRGRRHGLGLPASQTGTRGRPSSVSPQHPDALRLVSSKSPPPRPPWPWTLRHPRCPLREEAALGDRTQLIRGPRTPERGEASAAVCPDLPPSLCDGNASGPKRSRRNPQTWTSSPAREAWHATSSESKAAGTLSPGRKPTVSTPRSVPICSEKRREAPTRASEQGAPWGGADVRSPWAALEGTARGDRVHENKGKTLIVARCSCANKTNAADHRSASHSFCKSETHFFLKDFQAIPIVLTVEIIYA